MTLPVWQNAKMAASAVDDLQPGVGHYRQSVLKCNWQARRSIKKGNFLPPHYAHISLYRDARTASNRPAPHYPQTGYDTPPKLHCKQVLQLVTTCHNTALVHSYINRSAVYLS